MSNKKFEYKGLLVSILMHSVGVLILGGALSATLVLIHLAIVPILFKFSKGFRRNLIFANFVQWPPFVNFENVNRDGIVGGRNLSLEYFSKVDRCSIKIGIWHIPPNSLYKKLKDSLESMDKESFHKEMDAQLANSKAPIVLYCHGNANSRVASHRLELYKFFQNMDYHTIAFDYRGYGDSTRLRPSEEGVVEDSLMVYEWLFKIAHKEDRMPPVFVWGHSLGTGISSHLLGRLDELSASVLMRPVALPMPKGLILEAPFNSLADEVAHHPAATLVKWLPYFESCFVRPFRYCAVHSFRSGAHLSRTRSLPVMILHAEDDVIVPLSVGKKLYKSILESRLEGGAPVEMYVYDKQEGLGHTYICRAKKLDKVVGDFVDKFR